MKVHVIGKRSVEHALTNSIEKQRSLAAARSQLSDNCSHRAVTSQSHLFLLGRTVGLVVVRAVRVVDKLLRLDVGVRLDAELGGR